METGCASSMVCVSPINIKMTKQHDITVKWFRSRTRIVGIRCTSRVLILRLEMSCLLIMGEVTGRIGISSNHSKTLIIIYSDSDFTLQPH